MHSSVRRSWHNDERVLRGCLSSLTFTDMIVACTQEAAKEAAKDAGLSDDEEEEEEGTIRQVMPGETAAAAMAAAAAAANAQLPTTVRLPAAVSYPKNCSHVNVCMPRAAHCVHLSCGLVLIILLLNRCILNPVCTVTWS